MLFSNGKFTTALVLAPVGIYCIKNAAGLKKAYWLFALMPLMFGLQQFFEGLVWLGLESGEDGTTQLAARGYLFFSHLFWLVWIPLSCYAVEENVNKRKIYFVLIIFGSVHGLLLYVPLLFNQDWVTVSIVNYSIKYKAILLHDEYVHIKIMNLLYASFTIVPLLLASDRYLNVFGGIVVFSLAITSLFFDYAFVSVWCYFAAVISVYILYMIFQKTKIALNLQQV